MALGGGRDNIVAYFNKAKDEPQIQEQNIAQEEGKDSDRGRINREEIKKKNQKKKKNNCSRFYSYRSIWKYPYLK